MCDHQIWRPSGSFPRSAYEKPTYLSDASCAISTTTLQAGVERILSDRLAWVTEVRGGVDESVDPEESAAMGRGAYVPKYDY